jgi:hypothetical protein
VNVREEKGVITPLAQGVMVNERIYDAVVMCTGNLLDPLGIPTRDMIPVGTPTMARRHPSLPANFYRIGPGAEIPFTKTDLAVGAAVRRSNMVAMFRLTNRTAALAAKLS